MSDVGCSPGQMIREQIGDEEIDTRKASEVLSNLIEEGFGISSEVVKESSKKITFSGAIFSTIGVLR